MTLRRIAQTRRTIAKLNHLLGNGLAKLGGAYRNQVKDVTGKSAMAVAVAYLKSTTSISEDSGHGNEDNLMELAKLENSFSTYTEFWRKRFRIIMNSERMTIEYHPRNGWHGSRICVSGILADPLHAAKLVFNEIRTSKASHSLFAFHD